MIVSKLRTAAAVGGLALFVLNSPSLAAEKRCGWIENPTPGNWSFIDRDGAWELGAQGGYQAPGLDRLPDLSEKHWIVTNAGSYGYGCGCMTADTDRRSRRVTRLASFTQQPIAVCRRDRRLPKP